MPSIPTVPTPEIRRALTDAERRLVDGLARCDTPEQREVAALRLRNLVVRYDELRKRLRLATDDRSAEERRTVEGKLALFRGLLDDLGDRGRAGD
ncbi:MAG: hypothetical protein R3323_03010 [Wenzhouxiangellaceae bacterium]|nr:hypothetical protein [Wenzhouxiangellaceae bacterium]